MFCECGKLMTETEFGFECVCGKKKDREGNVISDSEADVASREAARISEIKKKYRYKYPNMSDPVIRVTEPVPENDAFDETFSSLRPSQIEKRKKNK